MSIPNLQHEFDSTCFLETDTLGLLATSQACIAFHDIYGGTPAADVDDYPRQPSPAALGWIGLAWPPGP